MAFRFALSVILAGACAVAGAAEVTLMSAGAVKSAFTEAAAQVGDDWISAAPATGTSSSGFSSRPRKASYA